MAEPIPLDAHLSMAGLAERVAEVCRRRLLERPGGPVPLEHIAYQTSEPEFRVRAAVEWLRRQGRVDLGRYALRSRPHVAVEAVERIDDLSAG